MSDYVTPGRPRPAPRREQGDKFIWDNYGGRLLLVEPLRFKPQVNTSYGARDVVNANITVIDTGERFHDAGIFPYYLVDQLKDHIGAKVPGRLAKQPIEGSDKLSWVLLPASEQDLAQVRHFEQTGQVYSAPPAQQGYPHQPLPQAPPPVYPADQAQQPQPAAYGSPQGQYPQQPAYAPQGQPQGQQWPPPQQGQPEPAQPQARPPWQQ